MFKGLYFLSSGRDGELQAALTLIEEHGGNVVGIIGNNSHSMKNIHALIVGKYGVSDTKIAHAIENGIPVVSFSWVTACRESGCVLEFGTHRSLRSSVTPTSRNSYNPMDIIDPHPSEKIRNDLFSNEKWLEIISPVPQKNVKNTRVPKTSQRTRENTARQPDVYVDPSWESSLRKGPIPSLKKKPAWIGAVSSSQNNKSSTFSSANRHIPKMTKAKSSGPAHLAEFPTEGAVLSSADDLQFVPLFDNPWEKRCRKPALNPHRHEAATKSDDFNSNRGLDGVPKILPRLEKLSLNEKQLPVRSDEDSRCTQADRRGHMPSGIPRAKNRRINTNDRQSVLEFVKNHPDGQVLDKEMVAQVLQQLITNDPASNANVSFADISGLENCKQAITESIILPFHRPELFTGLRKPSSALLLFGPPGNGKTMLAQAIACECNSTFFSLAASSLISKFVGDSEKAIRTLFTVAHILSPSILFFDEIDALLQSRGGSTELEGSRRLKTEFLIRVDGVKSNVAGEPSAEKRVVVIGATNRPFDLDDAVLRRFPKKIFVPLPAFETRLKILRGLFSDKNDGTKNEERTGVKIRMSESEWRSLAEKTEGYSSSDLSSLCKEIALVPIRELNLYEAMQIGESDLREIVFSDAKKCLNMIKPSTSVALLRKLEEWNVNFGSS